MNDPAIRQALHSRVIRHHHRNQKTLVVDELGLRHGQSRIDIAVINGKLSGIEIKSELDDLSRLPSQVDSYSSIFGNLTLAVASKYLARSLDIIPSWWGVISVSSGIRGGIHLKKVRSSAHNDNIDPNALATLLWRDEAIAMLREMGVQGDVLRQPRKVLYSQLVALLNINEFQSLVCATLKSRKHWRGRGPLL